MLYNPADFNSPYHSVLRVNDNEITMPVTLH